MAPTLRSALAPTFAWTASSEDLRIFFTGGSGSNPVDVSVPTGTYRMLLGPSSGAGRDFLRAVQTATQAALTAGGRSETITVTLTPEGFVRFAVSGGGTIDELTEGHPVTDVLGFEGGSALTAPLPPRHFATFVARSSNGWEPSTAVAGGETLDGVGYGVTSGVWHEEDEVTFGFVPPDPATAAALGVHQTPLRPAPTVTTAMLGSHPGAWSMRDILAECLGKTCAFAEGNLQALLTSTSERYSLVTLPAGEVARPRFTRLREGWDAYYNWTVRLLRQSAATGTRA